MDPAETQQLESAFNSAAQAAAAIEPGPNAPAQRRAVANELSSELASFAASHTNSAWAPSVRLWLARNARTRSQYSQAMEHYRQAWTAVAGSPLLRRPVNHAHPEKIFC